MQSKKKVLLIYNKIWPYRIKIFDEINRSYDLTVAYNDPSFIGKKYNFKTLYLETWSTGPMTFHKENLRKIAEQYDAIIGISNIGWISLMRLGFLKKRKFKLLYWGIGVRASYENKFDAENRVDSIRYYLTKKADAIIFYSSYPVEKYVSKGFSNESLFIADNTVYAPFNEKLQFKRVNFIFIGTLYKEKGIEILLEAYKSLILEKENMPKLKIVGGGDNYDNILNWIHENNLSHKIIMKGPIYDSKELEVIFRSSIACISPNQAGLSVLSSMAYGSIFITRKDAFTGGEVFNIIDKETGIFYNGTIEDLKEKMLYVVNNRIESQRISQNAMDHYRRNRTHLRMARQIIDAVEYTLNN